MRNAWRQRSPGRRARSGGLPALALASTVLVGTQAASAQDAAPPGVGSVKLFDMLRATHEGGISLSRLDYRPTSGTHWQQGWEVAGSIAITNRQEPFFITGYQATALRVLDSKSYSLSILQSGALVGCRVGPVEPEAGIAISTIMVDLLHDDFSVGMFSPKASAGFGIRLGDLRIGAHAYSEYLWRWLGTDLFVRGVELSVRIRRQPPGHPLFEGASGE